MAKGTKELLEIEMERENRGQKWGFCVQGGADVSLTAKIANVKVFTPAARSGLKKMDYVHLINGEECFKMTQPQIVKKIQEADLTLTLQVERGTFIVPSFDEIWPKNKDGSLCTDGNRNRDLTGVDYYLDAMNHHGLGRLPQPDNFTTCGRLNIEVNQYNNPVECYSDDTIEVMRDEKIIMENPDHADKILAANAAKLQKENPVIAQQMKTFDPKRSSVMMVINQVEGQHQVPQKPGL